MKVLVLTFIGTTDYSRVCYYLPPEEKCYPTPFPVVAYLKLKGWEREDVKVKVFATDEAKNKNFNYLKCEFKKIGVSSDKIEDVLIKKGENLGEIRFNFSELSKRLKDGFEGDYDIIVLDITLSLRSIPILAMISVLYAKALIENKEQVKNKSFHLIYGAFEVGKEKKGETYAPIFDLSYYYKLMELSLAVDEFVNYGTAERFGELAEELGDSPERRLARKLKELLDYVYVLRCPFIESFSFEKDLWEELEKKKDEGELFTKHLLKKVKSEVSVFSGEDSSEWEKALWAVKWCEKHRLYPQGYTILREMIISQACRLLREYLREDCINDYFCRERLVSGVLLHILGLKPTQERRENEKGRERWKKKVEEIVDCLKKDQSKKDKLKKLEKLANLFFKNGEEAIRKYRNDINHCGCSLKELKDVSELKEKLKDFIKEVEKLKF